MCGHVGVAGNIWKGEKEAFRLLLWHDYVRGPHSTGVGIATKDNHITYMKSIGSPEKLWEAFEGEGMTNGMIDAQARALIGHNRWATVGRKIGANAHPFMHGNIIGAHNGTLNAFRLSNFPKHKEFEVDSECIFESLSSDGFDKTMDRIYGAYALVWYDKGTEKMNFIRNKDRPLYVVWNDGGDALFWASEKWMLEVSLARCNIKHKEIQDLPVDTLYQLDVSKPGNMRNVELVEVKKHTGFEVPVYKAPFQGGQAGQTASQVIGGGKNSFVAITPSGSKDPDDGKWGTGKVYDRNKERWVFPVVDVKDVKDNIITLPVKTPKVDWAMYKTYNNKEIDFAIIGRDESRNSKTPFFAAELLDEDNPLSKKIDVRVYGIGHEKAQTWQTWEGYFNGNVRKAVNNKGEMYLLIDLRTIEAREYDNTQEVDNTSLNWYNGAKIDRDQWEERVICGCANCSAVPEATENEYVIWISPEAYLCPDCGTNGRVLAALHI